MFERSRFTNEPLFIECVVLNLRLAVEDATRGRVSDNNDDTPATAVGLPDVEVEVTRICVGCLRRVSQDVLVQGMCPSLMYARGNMSDHSSRI